MNMVAAITGAVDFADIAIGVGTIAGLLAVAYVAMKGASLLLGVIRR